MHVGTTVNFVHNNIIWNYCDNGYKSQYRDPYCIGPTMYIYRWDQLQTGIMSLFKTLNFWIK